MRIFTLGLLSVSALLPASLWAQRDEPLTSGYVTSISASGEFEVQGDPILVSPQTKFFLVRGSQKTPAVHLEPMYLGQAFVVWGTIDFKNHRLNATTLQQMLPAEVSVSGSAIIDAVEPTHDGSRTLRADGYKLRISPRTKLHFNEPVATLDQVSTNIWIGYRGVQAVDGQVDVSEAEVWPNKVTAAEAKLRKGNEFDAAGVSNKVKQSGAEKFFQGINLKKLPVHKDDELQARVNRIGQSLVPAYQRALSEQDPTRIDFRFQVIDAPDLRSSVGFPSGIVLVPYPAVSRLSTDDELAAVLADNIATALEKQAFLDAGTNFRLRTANWAAVGSAFMPGVGLAPMLATGLITGRIGQHLLTVGEQQSGRVSLWLMKDAGYDVRSAPMAWWTLAAKKGKTVEQTDLPDRASNLYQALGTTWRLEP